MMNDKRRTAFLVQNDIRRGQDHEAELRMRVKSGMNDVLHFYPLGVQAFIEAIEQWAGGEESGINAATVIAQNTISRIYGLKAPWPWTWARTIERLYRDEGIEALHQIVNTPPAPSEEAADNLWPDTLPWGDDEQDYYRTSSGWQREWTAATHFSPGAYLNLRWADLEKYSSILLTPLENVCVVAGALLGSPRTLTEQEASWLASTCDSCPAITEFWVPEKVETVRQSCEQKRPITIKSEDLLLKDMVGNVSVAEILSSRTLPLITSTEVAQKREGYWAVEGSIESSIKRITQKDIKSYAGIAMRPSIIMAVASALANSVEDTEPENNFGFMKEPHKELYPAAWEGEKMREGVSHILKSHVLNAIEAEYQQPDAFIYFTVYGSGASYNWDEEGDFDIQMWVDMEKFNALHEDEHDKSQDDLVADIRRLTQTVNFPTFADLGLTTPDCDGKMVIQYYPKPGTGAKSENLAQKPYACYDLETDEWIVRPKELHPTFYGDAFLMVQQKCEDIAMQAEAAIDELQRQTVNWQFWRSMWRRFKNPSYKEQFLEAQSKAEEWKEAVGSLFRGVRQDRADAYSPEGKGIEDERDLVQKYLEVWGIFQKLRHFAHEPLPWEEQELPGKPIDDKEDQETDQTTDDPSDSDTGSDNQKDKHDSKVETNKREIIIDFHTSTVSGWQRSVKAALKGLPEHAMGPHPEIQDIAHRYMAAQKLPYSPPTDYAIVDPSQAKRIADEYDKMPHAPNDPNVQASYQAMIQETLAQYKSIVQHGYTMEFYPPGQDPYPAGPRQALQDLHDNKHLFVYPTAIGYGMGLDVQEHPLLADSGIRWNGQPVTYNDLFRGVHDFFGHAKEGVGFRADGEENAWRQHSAMYSDLARPAMTAETRGQNSWVNFGPYGEQNQTANQENTIYPEQKSGLLPDWVHTEGIVSNSNFEQFFEDTSRGQNAPSTTLTPSFTSPEHQQFNDTYQGFAGHFDQHIETSIPDYREHQTRKGSAILKAFPGASVLDIGGSEGSWVKSLSLLGGHPTTNLEPNGAMVEHFNKNPVPNSEIATNYFGQDFEPDTTYDIVNESMTFQFISPDRPGQLAEVKRLLSPSGVFLTDEKVVTSNYVDNEQTKDSWKQQFYSPDQLAEKNKVVNFQGQPGTGMMGNMVTQEDLEATLHSNFSHVQKYWESGNFAGYIASDSPEVVSSFLIAYSGKTSGWKPFNKFATWDDVMADAQELYGQGAANVLNKMMDPETGQLHVIGEVDSQSNPGETYETEIWQDDPDSQAISLWSCDCEWGQKSWGRTRQWKKYEGRPCKHTLALYWQSLATPTENQLDYTQGEQTQGVPGQMTLPGMPPEGQTFEQFITQPALTPGGPSLPTQTPVEQGPAPVMQQPAPPSFSVPKSDKDVTQLELPGTLSSWRRVAGTFKNGDTVRCNVSVQGIDRDGAVRTIPRNSSGEVLWSDDEETIVAFPLNQSGKLEPHLVRVEAPTGVFYLSPSFNPSYRRRTST